MEWIVIGIIILVVGVFIGKNLQSKAPGPLRPETVFEEPPTANEVKIGHQTWMTRNLDVDCFRNGDPIPQMRSKVEWRKAGENREPAWCYYDNLESNGKVYGKLYNWHAVNDSRGLAPVGWHIPTDWEWTQLTDNIGGANQAGKTLKSRYGWKDGRGGTNAVGFTAQAGGCRYYDGDFLDIGSYGIWWSSSEKDATYAWLRSLYCDKSSVGSFSGNKEGGLSVRCLRD
jgi:uncharacterized protein (TIGR02145 family)